MKRILILMLSLLIFLSACSATPKDTTENAAQEATGETTEEVTITGEDFDPEGGADAYGFAGDNKESKYYKHPDFYNLTSGDGLVIIPKFKTYQQTTEWSCGNVSAMMVLNHFGKLDESEYAIAEKMGSSTDLDTPGAKPGSANNFHEYGSDVEQMTKYFLQRGDFKILETSYKEDITPSDLTTAEDGFASNDIGNLKPTFNGVALYASDNDPETENWVEDTKDSYFVKWIVNNLENNRPIMVEWGDWDGHWQVIIGYDSNNTPGLGDDVLIFADPYDTSDHLQDGYYTYPLERWFYMWQDRKVAPKPFQLQPYLVVEPVES